MANSMLSYSSLSEGFWGDAMLTVCHVLDWITSRTNKDTPYELWYKRKPNLNYIKVWGFRAIVRLPATRERNLVNEE